MGVCREGVDGRIFPWGNGYDRLISCSSRGMHNDKTKSGQRNGPARIDEFPYDVSPFGVSGIWVDSRSNGPVRLTLPAMSSCGGGLFATEAWRRAATRYAHAPERLGVQFGFRVAITAEI